MFHLVSEEVFLVKMSEAKTCIKSFCLRLVLIYNQSCYFMPKSSCTLNLSSKEPRCDASASILLKYSYRVEIEFTSFRFFQLRKSLIISS